MERDLWHRDEFSAVLVDRHNQSEGRLRGQRFARSARAVQTKSLYCHLAADGCNGCIREIAIGEDESWIRSGLAGAFRIVVSCGGGYDEQRANGGGGIPSGTYTMTVPGRGVRLHTVPSKRSKWESSRIDTSLATRVAGFNRAVPLVRYVWTSSMRSLYLRAQTSPWASLQLAELARTVSPQLSVNKVLD
jgi:hypothetical protein